MKLVRAVGWMFIGINKRRNLENDLTKLHPAQLIVASFLGMAIFIVVLLFVVHAVVGH